MISWKRVIGAAAIVVPLLIACGDDDDAPPPAGSNPTGVGNACAKNEDCAVTKNCYLGPGGGYCTTTCSDEGSTSQCPLDTICKPIQGGVRRCLLVCGSLSTCRETAGCAAEFCPTGSACVSVSNASAKACEPNP
jgi:hypothetical protein